MSWWKTFLLKFSEMAGPTWQYVRTCPDQLQILCAELCERLLKILLWSFYSQTSMRESYIEVDKIRSKLSYWSTFMSFYNIITNFIFIIRWSHFHLCVPCLCRSLMWWQQILGSDARFWLTTCVSYDSWSSDRSQRYVSTNSITILTFLYVKSVTQSLILLFKFWLLNRV